MSRNKHNAVPLIRYDFNRITDRRREARPAQSCEIFFRDTLHGERTMPWLFGKTDGRN
jgi:hypothetical protein